MAEIYVDSNINVKLQETTIRATIQQPVLALSFKETLLLSALGELARYISNKPDNMLVLDEEGKLYVKPSNEWASVQW